MTTKISKKTSKGASAQKKAKSMLQDSDSRDEIIALEAYLRAEKRAFQGGDPLDDWLAAEEEVDSRWV